MQISLANQAVPLCLPEGETRSLRLQAPMRVRVHAGLVWLTVEEGGADIWLAPGRDFEFHGRGLAVFEAVKGCAEFEVSPVPGWWSRLGQAVLGRRRTPPRPAAPSACMGGADAGTVRITHLLPRGLIRWF